MHVAIYLDAAPGPIARMTSVARHLRSRVTLLSSGPIPAVDGCGRHQLPSGGRGLPPVLDPTAFPAARADALASLAAWVGHDPPDLMVVDGSPDIALAARLAGVPVVPVRGFGRAPGPGQEALDHIAAAWLAPYPAVLEPTSTPRRVRERTLYAGLVSPFLGRRLSRGAARRRLGLDPDRCHVAIITGADGLGISCQDVAAVAVAVPSWSITVLGRCGGHNGEPLPQRVRVEGWLDDPLPHLVAADAVVAGASLSTVSDVAVARRPLGLVPRPTPDDEEARLAAALRELDAAEVLDGWPEPSAWPGLLSDLRTRDPAVMRRLSDGRGLKRAAEWIDAWAATPPSDPATELATAVRANGTPVDGVDGHPGRVTRAGYLQPHG